MRRSRRRGKLRAESGVLRAKVYSRFATLLGPHSGAVRAFGSQCTLFGRCSMGILAHSGR